MIKTAREVNTHKTEWTIEKIHNTALRFEREQGRAPVVACLGLSFKPDIDDLRESPALHIATRLFAEGVDILAAEPNIDTHETLPLCDYREALERADIVCLLVKHREFQRITVPQRKVVLDFCGLFPAPTR